MSSLKETIKKIMRGTGVCSSELVLSIIGTSMDIALGSATMLFLYWIAMVYLPSQIYDGWIGSVLATNTFLGVLIIAVIIFFIVVFFLSVGLYLVVVTATCIVVPIARMIREDRKS